MSVIAPQTRQTRLRWGGTFNDRFIVNFPEIVSIATVKELRKSASIWWTYVQN